MDGMKREQEKTKEDEENLQHLTDINKLQSAASALRLPNFETKKYSMPTFHYPAVSMAKIPREQTPKYNKPETLKPFILPAIQQSYQRPQQNTPRLSESSITSTESVSNKQTLPILPANSFHTEPYGASLPSLCNKSIKRPISKSNSSESSSDRSFSDTNNRGMGVAALPVEVTVSSRVEVKKILPDNLSTSSLKNG
jgi:hypothetical protein